MLKVRSSESGGRARSRLALGEAGGGRDPVPGRLVEETVEDDVALDGARRQGAHVRRQGIREQEEGREQGDGQTPEQIGAGHEISPLLVLYFMAPGACQSTLSL